MPGGGGLYICGTRLYVCYIKSAGWRRDSCMRHSCVCMLYKECQVEEGFMYAALVCMYVI